MGIPTLIHESNAVPGLTTKMLSGRVTHVMTGFDGTAEHYRHPEKVVFTGTPVRGEFLRQRKQSNERPLLLAVFGSAGAREMNRLMAQVILFAARDGDMDIHLATCRTYYAQVTQYLSDNGCNETDGPHIRVSEYIHNMPAVMEAADLIVSRAGTSTLNEIMVTGLPALLVPSPNVTNSHQELNAKELAKTGGCRVLSEEGLDAEGLYREIRALLFSPGTLAQMSRALLQAAVPNAAERVYELAMKLVGGN
jgi:UDP-N-acetylglucosamine--N-acetylmuramyl-(pentapeptide) pyrophosphoryl-undecaprenol N-acetylglucosamine transferase